MRPSFSLYELWCLFALRRLLGDALPGWQWTAIDLGKLLTLTGPGSGAGFVAQRGDQRLRIVDPARGVGSSIKHQRNDPRSSARREVEVVERPPGEFLAHRDAEVLHVRRRRTLLAGRPTQ